MEWLESEFLSKASGKGDLDSKAWSLSQKICILFVALPLAYTEEMWLCRHTLTFPSVKWRRQYFLALYILLGKQMDYV